MEGTVTLDLTHVIRKKTSTLLGKCKLENIKSA